MAGAGLPADRPLILKGSDGGRRVITAVDDLARHMGLRVGMPVAQAEAAFSDLTIVDADPEADALALEKLAIWALRHYSPLVCADPPDGLILNIQGADHLYGGEAGLIADARRRLADFGVTSQAALADTWGAAHALARFGGREVCLIEPGRGAAALQNLPIAALRLPAEMIEDLLVLGLDTIGELFARPRAGLAKTFDTRLLRRIDQAVGRVLEPIDPVEAPDVIKVHRIFAEPIGAAETIARYTGLLIEAMCVRLEEYSLGSRRLDLHFTRVDNQVQTIFVATAKPVRDVKRLTRLLCDKIETLDPGWGIEKMVLVAAFTEALTPTHVLAAFTEASRPDVEELWDILGNRHGAERLYRVLSLPTDIPERAVKRLPPTSLAVGSTRNALYRRPKRMYRPPEAIQALAVLPDHPPRAFTWRGQRYSVACADGPERVRGEWWVSDNEIGKVRDYYILEVESGERFWVFRGGDGQHENTGSLNWYLQGKFD